jgi:membrane-associated phospholipid phosphatase
MNFLKSQLKQGIFGTGWMNALLSVLLAVALYFTNGIYSVLNHGPNILFLKTPLDVIIPVIPPFVIPYVSLEIYIYVSLIVFMVIRTRVFRSAAVSMIAVWFISYAFYFFLQSYVDRPDLSGSDFFTTLIRGVYSGDNPYNDFPSLHTSTSTIMAIHWWRIDKRIGIPAAVWTALIVLSTVFIKQHYVADLFAGLALAFTASLLFLKLFTDKAKNRVEPELHTQL